MRSLQNELEAVLYSSRGIQPPARLISILDTNKEEFKLAIDGLIKRYQSHNGALEIRYESGGYILALKPEYYGSVRELIPPPAKDAVLATLLHIAREQPVAQSTIVALRGQKAYNHIRELVKRCWISKKRAGNTYILRTTKTFSEVFHCTEDPSEIKNLIEKASLPYLQVPGE